MRNSLATKTLAAVALGVVLLGHMSPVAAGMLFCTGGESGPECCPERDDSQESRLDKSTQLREGSDCDCCITVEAAPPTVGAGSQKAPPDAVAGSALLRKVAAPSGARLSGAPAGDAGETSLTSIRTVVLLI